MSYCCKQTKWWSMTQIQFVCFPVSVPSHGRSQCLVYNELTILRLPYIMVYMIIYWSRRLQLIVRKYYFIFGVINLAAKPSFSLINVLKGEKNMCMYVSEICSEGIFVSFPWWLKILKVGQKLLFFSNSCHFEIWFPGNKTITFF